MRSGLSSSLLSPRLTWPHSDAHLRKNSCYAKGYIYRRARVVEIRADNLGRLAISRSSDTGSSQIVHRLFRVDRAATDAHVQLAPATTHGHVPRFALRPPRWRWWLHRRSTDRYAVWRARSRDAADDGQPVHATADDGRVRHDAAAPDDGRFRRYHAAAPTDDGHAAEPVPSEHDARVAESLRDASTAAAADRNGIHVVVDATTCAASSAAHDGRGIGPVRTAVTFRWPAAIPSRSAADWQPVRAAASYEHDGSADRKPVPDSPNVDDAVREWLDFRRYGCRRSTWILGDSITIDTAGRRKYVVWPGAIQHDARPAHAAKDGNAESVRACSRDPYPANRAATDSAARAEPERTRSQLVRGSPRAAANWDRRRYWRRNSAAVDNFRSIGR